MLCKLKILLGISGMIAMAACSPQATPVQTIDFPMANKVYEDANTTGGLIGQDNSPWCFTDKVTREVKCGVGSSASLGKQVAGIAAQAAANVVTYHATTGTGCNNCGSGGQPVQVLVQTGVETNVTNTTSGGCSTCGLLEE